MAELQPGLVREGLARLRPPRDRPRQRRRGRRHPLHLPLSARGTRPERPQRPHHASRARLLPMGHSPQQLAQDVQAGQRRARPPLPLQPPRRARVHRPHHAPQERRAAAPAGRPARGPRPHSLPLAGSLRGHRDQARVRRRPRPPARVLLLPRGLPEGRTGHLEDERGPRLLDGEGAAARHRNPRQARPRGNRAPRPQRARERAGGRDARRPRPQERARARLRPPPRGRDGIRRRERRVRRGGLRPHHPQGALPRGLLERHERRARLGARHDERPHGMVARPDSQLPRRRERGGHGRAELLDPRALPREAASRRLRGHAHRVGGRRAALRPALPRARERLRRAEEVPAADGHHVRARTERAVRHARGTGPQRPPPQGPRVPRQPLAQARA